MKKLISLAIVPLPWFFKRLFYKFFFNYEIHPSAHIGFSWIYVDNLTLKRGVRIGNLNVIKGLNILQIDEYSIIGNLNWISAFPLFTSSKHFQHEAERRIPALILGAHASITNRHYIDCTNRFEIKRFTTFAGFKSTVLTHSIDLKECRQASKPITIGEYCFVGTGCILLGGTVVPDYSVLAAGSTIHKPMEHTYALYGGSPAKFTKSLEKDDLQYFKRTNGFIF
ncbi:MAG: hypothetical protein NTX38_08845 [Methylobacter sp.]|nr:hypothetical protein [Methylobacter sp.]